jgi:hypothetical protein
MEKEAKGRGSRKASRKRGTAALDYRRGFMSTKAAVNRKESCFCLGYGVYFKKISSRIFSSLLGLDEMVFNGDTFMKER